MKSDPRPSAIGAEPAIGCPGVEPGGVTTTPTYLPLVWLISKEKDMTETFNVGDLVEAVHGDTIIRGRLNGCDGNYVGTSRRSTDGLHQDGFTLTVIEKALPPLPTEPGIYLGKSDTLWQLYPLGNWWCLSLAGTVAINDYAPFTRLAPVAEALKKVRNFCAECGELEAIAAEYGVVLS